MRQTLPYDMFDVSRSAEEARRYSRMATIYHKGQERIWDGREVLDELWERHGGAKIAPEHVAPAQRVLGSIMWGELAAWKIAVQLGDVLEPLEARMAATSQAHDEARHFYVMHDYLVRATGDFPRSVPKDTEKLLAASLFADSIPKKLLGMQLQLETIALTLFQSLREARVCPVLSDLFRYYERDEARHVGLGMQLLPAILERMSPARRFAFSAFSMKVGAYSIASLKTTENDLRALGIEPRKLAALGKSKQMLVFDELFRLAPGTKSDVGERVGHVLDAVAEALWPDPSSDRSVTGRAKSVLRTFRHGFETVETEVDPDEAASARAPVAFQ